MANRGISPTTNGGSDLGSTSKRWRKLYVQSAEENMDISGNYSIGYRKPNKGYSVGDIAYSTAFAPRTAKKLVCVKAGTSANSNLVLSSNNEGALIADGTVAWVIDSLADGNYSAEHGNGSYRGANITAYWNSGYLSANIQNNTFVGVHLGDYIVNEINIPEVTYTDKSGTEVTTTAQTYSDFIWLIAGFDTHLYYGNPSVLTHHLCMISKFPTNDIAVMNPTADATGGYIGSDMWTVHMPIWSAAVKEAFGASHVLQHSEALTNAIDASAPSGGAGAISGTATGCVWTDVDVNIPSESMLFGGRIFGSGADSNQPKLILPLFQFMQPTYGSFYWWTRTVALASGFTRISGALDPEPNYANLNGRIRPYFLLY